MRGSGENIFLLNIFLLAIFGGFDEIHQIFIPLRRCEFTDFLSDILGGICGVGIYGYINNIWKKI